MPAPCEIAVKSLIPAIRAYIAKELIRTYKMKQTEVAYLLGITQTAVSKYVSNVRGQAVRLDRVKEIQGMMNEAVYKIADRKVSGPQLTLEICYMCRAARRTRLICHLCERVDPTLKNTLCNVCRME